MVIESIVAIGMFSVFKHIRQRDIIKIEGIWKRLIVSSTTKGLSNSFGETFTIKKVYRTQYGYYILINIPYSLRVTTLFSIEEDIVRAYGCKVVIRKGQPHLCAIKLYYNEVS